MQSYCMYINKPNTITLKAIRGRVWQQKYESFLECVVTESTVFDHDEQMLKPRDIPATTHLAGVFRSRRDSVANLTHWGRLARSESTDDNNWMCLNIPMESSMLISIEAMIGVRCIIYYQAVRL